MKNNNITKIMTGHIVRPSSPVDAIIHPLRRRIVRVFLAILSPIDPESSIIGNPGSKYDFLLTLMYIAIPNQSRKSDTSSKAFLDKSGTFAPSAG